MLKSKAGMPSGSNKHSHGAEKGSGPKKPSFPAVSGDADLDGNFASVGRVVRDAAPADDSSSSDDDVPIRRESAEPDSRPSAAASAPVAKPSNAAAVADAPAAKKPSDDGVGVGKKRSRAEMQAAQAAAEKKKDEVIAVAGAGAGAEGEPTTYQRVAKDLLSKKPAEAQVDKFWALYTGTKIGAKLSDEEVLKPLTAAMIATGGAASITGRVEDLSDLAAFIKGAFPAWKTAFTYKSSSKRPQGCPAVVIVSYSAQRCAAMLKPLSSFGTRIAKLFAKHLSVDEQREILKGPPVTMAVGTPNRLHKMLSLEGPGSLSLSHCSLIVFDVHPDNKTFTLLNHPNLKEDAFTLYRDFVHPALVRTNPAPAPKLALY